MLQKRFFNKSSFFLLVYLIIGFESQASCPAQSNLVTLYNENNGQAGVMFDINALEDVTILCFDVNLYTGTHDYQIYYKEGTHVGFEGNQAAWTLIGGPVSVTSNGTNVPTYIPIPINVSIDAGESAAFYITCNRTNTPGGGIEYTDGFGVGNVIAADANIEVLDGTGKAWPFSTNFVSRQFNGTVYYDACLSNPEIDSILTTNPSCSNSDGEILVNASGLNQPYTYSLNNDTPQISNIFTGLSAGVYEIKVEDTTGCYTLDTVELFSPDLPLVEAFGAQVCEGDSIPALTATGTGFTYNWYTNPDLDSTALIHQGETFMPPVSIPGDYTYYVTATDSLGICESPADTAILSIIEIPSPPLAEDEFVCMGVTVPDLIAQGDNIIWYSDSTLAQGSIVNTGNTFATGETDMGIYTYYLTQSDTVGCVSPPTVVTLEIGEIDLDISLLSPISCFGEEDAEVLIDVIGGEAPFTYDISPSSGTQQDSLFSNLGSGVYTFTIEDVNGCLATDSIEVIEPDVLTLNVTANDLNCFNDNSGAISINASGGTDPLSYSIDDGLTYHQDSTFDSLSAGIYIISVMDENACEVNDTIELLEPQMLTLDVDVTNVLCYGENTGEIVASPSGGVGEFTYDWSPELSNDSLQINLAAGTYNLTITDENGCEETAEILVMEPVPVSIDIEIDPNTNILGNTVDAGTEVPFVTNVITDAGPGTYTWLPQDILSCTDCSDPIAFPEEDTEFIVLYTDENGCTATDTFALEVVIQGSVYIPNAFSPNGDGVNDVFEVYGVGITDLTLRIFNRWGDMIFKSEDVNAAWDGTYNGRDMTPGVYIYMATVILQDGRSERFYGSVTLVR
ncbi:MAG: hypothetical protein EA412_01680 [Chitinophagaceae bacterium]|nr:MAG: hypothetical protein EA412_01680 [Chitinophagaceae bacterium]